MVASMGKNKEENTMKKPNRKNTVITVCSILLFIILMIAIYFALWTNNIKTSEYSTKELMEELEDDGYIPDIPENLLVGDEVTYIPESSTYNWAAQYCSGSSSNDILLDNESENFNITKWRVLNINKETGIIDLISNKSTIGKLPLDGTQGYNNAVKLLNDACNALYGNNKKQIKARSIKLEDIIAKIPQESLQMIYNNSKGQKGEEKITFLTQPTTEYKRAVYPIIYENEKFSVINGYEKQDGLDISEQNELYPRVEGKLEGNASRANSIKPYQTFFSFTVKNDSKKDPSDITNIISAKNRNDSYWIATRSIHMYNEDCLYVIYEMTNTGVGMGHFCTINNLITFSSSSLRPIVSVRANLLVKDNEIGWIVK